MDVIVNATLKSYKFLDAKSWSVDELFLMVESKTNGGNHDEQ